MPKFRVFDPMKSLLTLDRRYAIIWISFCKEHATAADNRRTMENEQIEGCKQGGSCRNLGPIDRFMKFWGSAPNQNTAVTEKTFQVEICNP